MRVETTVLGVMARAPIAPLCKTRLQARLSPAEAAAIAGAMTRDTLEAVDAAGFDHRFVFATGAADDDAGAIAALTSIAPPGWTVVAQARGDLGARMEAAFATMFAEGAARAALIGTDSPTAPMRALRDALAGLQSGVMIGPSDDGGYWTIAMTRLERAVLHDLPWSTPQLAEATRSRCAAEGLASIEIARAFDVDEPADIERLARLLERDPGAAPHTARWLLDNVASWGAVPRA